LTKPVLGDDSGEVEAFVEVGPAQPEYAKWLGFSEEGKNPQPQADFLTAFRAT
jgi:hypothetical protein